jgi:hypothetical protein
MLRILRTVGVPALIAVAVSAACSSKESNQEPGSGGAGGGGSGGMNGGRSGSSTHAGSAGKTGGKGGSTSTSGAGGADAGAGALAGAGGQGGEGGAPECPGCDSGFCLEDGSCVDCLPTNDHCSDGMYCTDANVCVAGCKANGGGCASGSCDANHNCDSCIADAECLAPLLCNSGTCSAACTAEQEGTTTGCDGGLTCCALHCSELEDDSQNCGSCGHACGSGQFCGLSDCHDTTLANVCSVSKIIVILDTTKNASDGNRTPGRQVGAALHAQCDPAPVLTEAEQDSVDALNLTTGRPVSAGGELLVVAGGPFFQNLEGYLEEQKIAPLYWAVGDGFTEFRKTADDAPVLHLDIAGDHDSHDFFIIQFSRDPASGSLILNVQGFWLSGTVAAAYQVTTGFLPQLGTLDKGWYAYEWTDADGDKAPDADEIKLVDSGT